LGRDQEGTFDQHPISRQGIKGGAVVHGGDPVCAQSPITLAAGIEQASPRSKLIQSLLKLVPGGGIAGDVKDLSAYALLRKPSKGLAAGSAGPVSVEANAAG
jgi:hypothetical protein